MAEDLVGAAVKISLDKVVSFATDQIGIVKEFKKDLENLRDTVGMISAVVDDAEEKQANHMAVKLWLKKLEALACRAEHVFDEVNYEMLRREMKNRSCREGMVSFFSSHNSIVFRLRMAQKLKDINNEFEIINKKAIALGLQVRLGAGVANTTVPSSNARSSREKDSVVGQKVIGRDNDASKIVNKLLTPSNELITHIPIRGMAGIGKTTLAQLVYNNEQIVKHFGERIWIGVPEDCEPLNIFKLILESLTKDNVERLRGRDTVVQMIKEKLKDKRYLLVLDDVWSANRGLWDDFLSSLLGISTITGNWIIVTTRQREVASIFSVGSDFPLERLSDEDCLDIVKEKAFISDELIKDFEAVRGNIIKLCQGVPLVARVIGGLLHTNPMEEWISVLQKGISYMTGYDDFDVRQILKLSFDRLPSLYMKKCFTYCSLFEKDSTIQKKELIQIWIAEGFLQPKPGHDDMEIGNECINSLLGSSLLQEVIDEDGKFEYVRMHDFVHDLARSISNPTKDLKDVKEEDRYIVINSFGEETKTLPKMRMLQTLFLRSGTPDSMSMKSFKYLHVLKLSYVKSHKLPSAIGKLIHLRYFGVSNSWIETLPDSISELYNLQTLRIEKFYAFQELPKGITKLINLRHLHCNPGMGLPPGLPPKIGRLTSLQTLEYFDISEDNQIKELGCLKNLRGKLTIYNLDGVSGKEEAEQAGLNKKLMNSLSFNWHQGNENDEKVLEGLQPHPYLQELEIHSFSGNQFPSWFMNMAVFSNSNNSLSQRLDRLASLSIESCKKCKHLPALGQLPSLKYLKLNELHDISCIEPLFYGIDNSSSGFKNNIGSSQVARKIFPALKHLEVGSMKNLKEWMEYQSMNSEIVEIFPNLEKLYIQGCPQLSSAPIHYFQSLKNLKICITNLDRVFPMTEKDQIISRSPNSRHVQEGIFTSLESLVIGSCPNLSELPEYLFKCQSLRNFEIRNCSNLKSLPILMEQQCLTSLQKLVIDGCHGLTSLPHELLSSCPSLTNLGISACNQLSSLPADLLKSCVSLHSLTIIDCNGLSSLPADLLKSCASLHFLNITRCSGLSSLPNDLLKSCASLYSLDIDTCNGLSSLPDDLLKSCPSLHSLGIWYCNGLTSLPPDLLKSCVPLESLTIADCNGLSILPVDLLKSCVSLHSLAIWYCNGLTSLPANLLKSCVSLHFLTIRNCNGLSTLPPDLLKSCVSLHTLGIWYCNGLNSLPSHLLKSCTSLHFLTIRNCKGLSNLPADLLKSCVSLHSVTIIDCDGLSGLPTDLFKSCTSLHSINIDTCNGLSSPPSSLLKSCVSL